ncbi:hypothetical protein ABEG63_15870 [Chryseobacterium sp. C39-AII1]|uniref:hypothetical protein n=1 Tax=Chryseobacterium sp. C39-AII1 TaxID=3080332 RepID=UPI003209F468
MGKILSGIKGERFPLIGKQAQKYSVTFDESVDIGTINDDEILWQIYAANEYDEYEKVPFSGQKKGRLTTYTFLEKLLNKNLQLQATYKNETVELHITPQANGEIKIIDVFFLDVEYKIREKDNLKYMNSVNLQIYTLNMLDKYVDFKIFGTLNGIEKELYKSDQPLKIEQKNGIVKTKKSILLSPAMFIQTQQDLSASVHSYRIKVWETDNESNFYEEGLIVKNEMGKMEVPQDSQTPVKTGTSEPVKKKEERKTTEKTNGYYYNFNGIYEGRVTGQNGNESDVYACEGKGSEKDTFVNAKKLLSNHEKFIRDASTTYGESSAAYNIIDKLEFYSIASVHKRNKVAFGVNSSFAKNFRSLSDLKRNENEAMIFSIAAEINALLNGHDYSNGAKQWDGAEQTHIPKDTPDISSNGRFMFKVNVMGWDIKDEHYKSWKLQVSKKFGEKYFTAPQKKYAVANYGKMTNKNKIRLNSVAQYGLTMFWKEVDIIKK